MKQTQLQAQLHLLEQPKTTTTKRRASYTVRYIIQVRRSANPNASFKPPLLTTEILPDAHRHALHLADSTGLDVRIQEQIIYIPNKYFDTYEYSKPRTIARAYVKDRPKRYVSLVCKCSLCEAYMKEWGIQSVHNVQDVVYNQAKVMGRAREEFNTKYFG